MRLNPGSFNALLDTGPSALTQAFLWRRASSCPCTNPMSGAANIKCKQCRGKGFIWSAPVPANCGMSSQQNLKLWAQFGQYEVGDATLTIPESSPLYDAGRFDRIQAVNSSERFSKSLIRGGPGDRFFQTVISIDRVFWLDAEENIVEGGIPVVEADGEIIFTDGAPPFNTQYSISGYWRDEYFVYQHIVSDRSMHLGARLPKKVLARKLDLLLRS